MYYYQVEKFQQSSSIYHFGRHYLTRLQIDVIVKSYKQTIRESKHLVLLEYSNSTANVETRIWDKFCADFLRGDNINNSLWDKRELLDLKEEIKHKINLHIQKPIVACNKG